MALDRNNATYQASAMAFWLFLGMIPLVAVVGWAVTAFGGESVRETIVNALMAITPDPAHNIVNEQMQRLVNDSDAVAPLSLIGFLWIASGGVHTAIDAIQMSQVGQARSWIRNRGLAMAFVVAFLIGLIVCAALMVSALPTLRNALEQRFVHAKWLGLVRYSAAPLALAGTTILTGVFFRYAGITEQRAQRKRVWPGAAMVGLSWVAISWIFSLYVRSIGRYPILYGSLATVALLMLWLWICSFVLLVGSELNLQMEGSRETMVPKPAASKAIRLRKLPPPLARTSADAVPPSLLEPHTPCSPRGQRPQTPDPAHRSSLDPVDTEPNTVKISEPLPDATDSTAPSADVPAKGTETGAK